MFKQLWTALRLFVILSIVTGIVYPLVVTGIAQIVFPHQANGSLIVAGDKARRLGIVGPEFRRSQIFLGPALGHFGVS